MANSTKTQKSTTSASSSKRSAGASNGASKSLRTGSKSTASKGKQQEPGALLEKFFHDQLKDIYYAEKLLVKTLPKMRKAATTPQLQAAFETHLTQTQGQIKRLEQVFEMMGKKAQAKKCDAMEGLVKEGEHAIEETKEDSLTRDVALIMSAQKVEHYEIASYGTLCQLAKTMGQHEVATLLERTLDEEKETDMVLNHIAQNNVNQGASKEGQSGRGGAQGMSQGSKSMSGNMNSGKGPGQR